MTKFLIIMDGIDVEGRNAVTFMIQNQNVAWAKYFQNVWLVRDPQGREARWWFDAIDGTVAGGRILVMPVDSGRGWVARGPSALLEWLRHVWLKSD